MAAPDLVNLSALIDDARCFALVRQHRRLERGALPRLRRASVVRDGFDEGRSTATGSATAARRTRALRRPWACPANQVTADLNSRVPAAC
jgi:hypothetical protein